MKIGKIIVILSLSCAAAALAPPGASLGKNFLPLSNGLDLELYTPEDVLAMSRRDALGRLVFELPNGTSYYLIEDISDPRIANKGDGEFHPMKTEIVIEALAAVSVSGADLDCAASVYILPYPRSGFLASSACGDDIFLSPGVLEIAPSGVARTVTHELGHVFQRRHAPEGGEAEAWKRYCELREIAGNPVYSADAAHMYRPVEIFAEDFRFLFGGPGAGIGGIENPALPAPDRVSGLEDFFVSLVAGERVVSVVAPEPLACTLSNYPNPFNPSTTITAALTDAPGVDRNDVSLAVYRVDGSLVRELYRGPALGGELSVRWDGTDERGAAVSSGLYFYRVKAGRQSATGKMLLIR